MRPIVRGKWCHVPVHDRIAIMQFAEIGLSQVQVLKYQCLCVLGIRMKFRIWLLGEIRLMVIPVVAYP